MSDGLDVESIPTFSSCKKISECKEVIRVAQFPAPPFIEEELATAVDWEAALPPPDRWPKDLDDLFDNNPAGARTWSEVEKAMRRLVSYHTVSRAFACGASANAFVSSAERARALAIPMPARCRLRNLLCNISQCLFKKGVRPHTDA
jgi:hypothetical protein